MKDNKNNNLDERLKERTVADQAPGKDAFWHEFRQRAQSVVQDSPAPAAAIPFPGAVILKVAACFLLIAVVISVYTVYNYSGTGDNKQLAQRESIIEDYEIFTPNDGVLILQDEKDSGTILWVMDTENSKQDSNHHET